jgi:hypothetical protein
LRTLENCDATVRSHVGGAGPDRHLKHRHSNHSADDENVTGHKAKHAASPSHPPGTGKLADKRV